MASVDDFISIDQELDSRIGQLSIDKDDLNDRKKRLEPSVELGTFIIEKKNKKLNNGKSDYKSKKTVSMKENIYNPENYSNNLPDMLLTEQNHKTKFYSENGYDIQLSEVDNLEDFLTEETQAKLMSLKLKNDYLTKSLTTAEKQIRKLMIEMDDNKKRLNSANKEVATSDKLLTSSKKLVEKKEKELKETKVALTTKTRQCQELTKNLTAMEKREKGDQKKLLLCQNHNNRLKQQLDETKIKINSLSTLNKSEKEKYFDKYSSSDKTCSELKKKVLSLTNIIKKQNELVAILQQQKSNIAAAKAAHCLEEQFLSLIAPFKDHS